MLWWVEVEEEHPVRNGFKLSSFITEARLEEVAVDDPLCTFGGNGRDSNYFLGMRVQTYFRFGGTSIGPLITKIQFMNSFVTLWEECKPPWAISEAECIKSRVLFALVFTRIYIDLHVYSSLSKHKAGIILLFWKNQATRKLDHSFWYSLTPVRTMKSWDFVNIPKNIPTTWGKTMDMFRKLRRHANEVPSKGRIRYGSELASSWQAALATVGFSYKLR